jgi:hypothetical protein
MENPINLDLRYGRKFVPIAEDKLRKALRGTETVAFEDTWAGMISAIVSLSLFFASVIMIGAIVFDVLR